jgi:hypothetical protein
VLLTICGYASDLSGCAPSSYSSDKAEYPVEPEAIMTVGLQLDQNEYPFARSAAGQMRAHDDREDFSQRVLLVPKHVSAFFRYDRSVLIISIVFMVSALRTIPIWRTP